MPEHIKELPFLCVDPGVAHCQGFRGDPSRLPQSPPVVKRKERFRCREFAEIDDIAGPLWDGFDFQTAHFGDVMRTRRYLI